MAYEELPDLDASETIALGGVNKKTGKPNPSKIEGYFIGTRTIESAKSKTGVCSLHIFQTPKGNVGVWGKTNLDQKLKGVTPGFCLKVEFTGMKETKNNPMYTYKVSIDKSNKIDISSIESPTSTDADTAYSSGEVDDTDLGDDDVQTDVIQPSRPQAPPRASAVDADRAAKVNALLNRGRKTA